MTGVQTCALPILEPYEYHEILKTIKPTLNKLIFTHYTQYLNKKKSHYIYNVILDQFSLQLDKHLFVGFGISISHRFDTQCPQNPIKCLLD